MRLSSDAQNMVELQMNQGNITFTHLIATCVYLFLYSYESTNYPHEYLKDLIIYSVLQTNLNVNPCLFDEFMKEKWKATFQSSKTKTI